jgi:hypothetical protein
MIVAGLRTIFEIFLSVDSIFFPFLGLGRWIGDICADFFLKAIPEQANRSFLFCNSRLKVAA